MYTQRERAMWESMLPDIRYRLGNSYEDIPSITEDTD